MTHVLLLFRPAIYKHLKRLGLAVHEVPGDGHCMFHAFSVLEPQRSFQEWREVLSSQLEERAAQAKDGEDDNWFLARANQQLRTNYSSFGNLMENMRKNEWGYSDFITEFTR